MQFKSVMLMLSMTVGLASYAHSAQIQPQTPKQEVSLIKSVADAKKTTATAKDTSQLTALDKMIQSAKLSAVSKPSTEESQALAKLNNQKLSVVSRNKKFSNLFQNLFGS